MKYHKIIEVVRAGCALACIGFANNVLAADESAAPNNSDYTLTEIVITATKREESLSKVPASVAAFSERDLQAAGATLVTGGKNVPGKGYRYASTLLRVPGKTFLSTPHELQREAFGNEVMAVVLADDAELKDAPLLRSGAI